MPGEMNAELYRVKSQVDEAIVVEEIGDPNIIDLAPGEYVAKPIGGEGCWLDATWFTVKERNLP